MGIGCCLLLLVILGLFGCGGGADSVSGEARALKSVGWYYQNIAPDYFNNGTTCYLSVFLYLDDAVSAADVDSFVISAPNGGGWNIPASGRQTSTNSSGTTYFPLLLRYEDSPSFPLAGVWTMSVKLKDGSTSSMQKTFHDPGSSADATYQYLYASEDWAPSANQSQYVPVLKRFPATGYSFQYSSAGGGKITTTGFSAVRAAFLVTEPKIYNLFCWLYDANQTYLGYTIRAYSSVDHSDSGLITGDGEISIVSAVTNSGNSVDLSQVKYARVVLVDGAQFAPKSCSTYDNQSVSSLIPVVIGGNEVSTTPPAPLIPPVTPVTPVTVATFSYQSQLAIYTISMPKIVNYAEIVPITFTVNNISNVDLDIDATPVRVYSNNVQLYFSANPISSGIVSIKPGETKTIVTSWSNKDDNGNNIQAGNYFLVGSCLGTREETDLDVNFTVQ